MGLRDGEMGRVDAAQLLHTGIDVHKRLARGGNIEKRIGLRWMFAEPPTNKHDEIGIFHARQQFGIWPDAEVAGI